MLLQRPLRRVIVSVSVFSMLFQQMALPAICRAQEGANIVAGAATVSRQANVTTINSQSQRAIINWNKFNIPAGHTTSFNQPNANAAVLNRVVGKNHPSAIYGTLNSNGNVFLINPSGILVGPSGVINTNGFTASTLDIPDQEFLNGGPLHFRGDSTAGVINQGKIYTGTGGTTLIGNYVINEGLIESLGKINLIAGGSVQLDGGGKYIQADSATVQNGISETAGLIKNSGTIRATGAMEVGGEVYLVAPGGKVMQEALIAAQKLNENGETIGGKVVVDSSGGAARTGETNIRGSIDVSGALGGEVVVTGDSVALEGAKIDTSGLNGGGTVNIGGGYQGSDASIANSLLTTVDENSTINADATILGSGGQIIVWSDDTTYFAGTATVRGGELGGDGGFVETSGLRRLGVSETAIVNALAPNGLAGDWLLDPKTVTVQAGGGATLAQIADGADTTSDLIVDPTTINNALANVSIVASDTITVVDAINMTNAGVGLTANGTTIDLRNNITTNGGAQVYNGNVVIGADLTLSGGAVTINGLLNADDAANNRVLSISSGTGAVSLQGGIGTSDAIGTLDINTGTETGTISLANVGSSSAVGAGTLMVGNDASSTINFTGTHYATTASQEFFTTNGGDFNVNGGSTTTFRVVGTSDPDEIDFTGGDLNLSSGSNLDLQLLAGGIIYIRKNLIGSGAETVKIQGGTTRLFGNSISNIQSLDVSGASASVGANITTSSVNTTGNFIRFTQAISAAGITMDTSAANGSIELIGNRTEGNGGDLTLNAGTGTVTVTQLGNNNNEFNEVTITAGTLQISDGIRTRIQGGNPGNVTLNVGEMILTGDVLLNTTIDRLPDTADGTVSITGPINSASGENHSLTIVSEATTFGGALGGTDALAGLSVTANSSFAASGAITTSDGDVSILSDNISLGGAIDAGTGTVTFAPVTAGQLINLGGADAVGTLGLTAAELDLVSAGALRVGSSDAGNITITDQISPANVGLLSLETGGGIIDGNASGADLTVNSLALRAAGGIGAADDLNLAVSNLAFTNTSGAVNLSNSGALTIGSVDGITFSSNTGTTTSITAASPLTFAAGVTSAGNLTVTAGESGTVDTDNLTVNSGVLVQSTGGDVTLQAGDDVILGSNAVVGASGVLNLTAGHNDVDGDGGITTSSTVTLAGNPINLNAINDINLGLLLSAAGNTVNVTSTNGDISFLNTSGTYSFGNLSVTGNSINLGAMISTTGTQTYNSSVLLTGDTVLSSTGSGNITFNDTINGLFGLTVNTGGTTAFNGAIGIGGDRLGSLTTDAGGTTAFNLSANPGVDVQGDAFFGDNVTVSGGGQKWRLRGNTTFDGSLSGNVDQILQAFNPITFNGPVSFTGLQVASGGQININGGSITTTIYGLDLYNDVVLGADTVLTANTFIRFRDTLDGAYALTMNSPGQDEFRGVVGGITPLVSLTTDAGGTTLLKGGALTLSGNTLTFNDAVVLGVDTLITDAGAVTFNNTVDGAFALTVDAGGNISFNGAVGGTDPPAFLDLTSAGVIFVNAPITTADGNIDFSADVIEIDDTIDAGTAVVTLAPYTAGLTIDLGTETAGSLGLTAAELDFITAGILRIGSADAGSITFSDTISLTGTDTLSLITGDAILDANGGVDVQVANLALQAVNGIASHGADIILDTEVDTIAALNTTVGGISILETSAGGDLIVGTVDAVVGIRNEASTGFAPNFGVQLETNNGDLTVNSDIFNQRRNIFIVAQQGNGSAGDSTFTNNANIINADSGNNANYAKIDIRANNMTLNPGSTISAANRVILQDDPSSTATVAINLGGADGFNTLGLTDAELDTVTTAGVLQIGHLNGGGSGNITISDAITLDPAMVSILDLETGGAIIDNNNSGFDLTVDNLVLRSGTGIGDGDDLNLVVSNLAFDNDSGAVDIDDFSSLAITALDGLVTSSNSGTTTEIQSGGLLTFAVDTSSAGAADYGAGVSVDVANGVVVSSGNTLNFDASTVNLDGNLTATSGITGTATTVNVIGSSGGAELQDAVDVANVLGATVNVAAGTYTGGVQVDKPLTMLGDGYSASTIVNVADGTAGMTVNASSVTIDGFLFTGDGSPVDATGILVHGSGGALSDILIGDANADNLGSRFTGLTTGVSVSDGGTGNPIGITVGLGNVIDNSADGVVFDGANVDIVGDTLNDLSFAGISGNYIELVNGAEFLPGTPTVIDIAGVSFDGVLPGSMTVGELAALENQLVHYLDLGTVGLLDYGSLVVPNGSSIQLAVNAAGVLGGPQTVTVEAGTFGGSVELWVEDLTLVGQGATTIIDADVPDPFANLGDLNVGFLIDANNVTVQDFAIQGNNSSQAGIVINGSATADLTGINIVNVDLSNLLFGVISVGDIGDGNAATVDVTIRGNSNADRAVFEDFLFAAVVADDTDGDAVYLIQDLIIQDGSDADSLAAGFDGIALGDIGAATIQGVNMTDNAGFDGILILPFTLTDANILIGGPNPEDANTIRGLSDGIDTGNLSGGSFVVQGNDLIFGGDDAVDVNGTIFNNANVQIVGNQEITGNEDGLDIGNLINSTVIVADNTRIQGVTQNGIEFEGGLDGSSAVQVTDNTQISGGIFAIEFRNSIQGNSTVLIDHNGSATLGGSPYHGTGLVNLENFAVTGSITGGIQFGLIDGNAAVTVSRNIISGGAGDGISFNGGFGTAQTTKVYNNFILGNGGNGISFGGDISAPVKVFQNFIAGNGGDAIRVGPAVSINPNALFVQQNFLPGSGVTHGNGGFGFNHLGTGAPDINGNWWGGFTMAEVASAINGVGHPTVVLLFGDDTNIPGALGQSGLDPFAFQNSTALPFEAIGLALNDNRFLTYDRFIRYQDYFISVPELIDLTGGAVPPATGLPGGIQVEEDEDEKLPVIIPASRHSSEYAGGD